LVRLGFRSVEVGALVTGTMLGSAALTLAVGLLAHHWRRRALLLAACALMLCTGLGFMALDSFWPLLLVAVIGTLNPSAGDVSVFLPIEQSALAQTVGSERLTSTFAVYNLSGALAGAIGSLASGAIEHAPIERLGFVIYAAIALPVSLIYALLSPSIEAAPATKTRAPLEKSRSIVVRLTVLFSIDAFGGGFIVQSLLALWLFRRFSISTEIAGAIFFASGVMGAFSQLVSSRLADRFGRVNTMVYTHLPSNAFLILAALMTDARWAVAFLLMRAAISQMDVPARQSYVMAMVPPEERAAASSVTNVPRSLAAAVAPLMAGWMLDHTLFGWPLIIGGALKAVYDVLLLLQFRAHKPADER
jgi:predicted MFS family arabinose efflux permease